jgi:hypothetical protein
MKKETKLVKYINTLLNRNYLAGNIAWVDKFNVDAKCYIGYEIFKTDKEVIFIYKSGVTPFVKIAIVDFTTFNKWMKNYSECGIKLTEIIK